MAYKGDPRLTGRPPKYDRLEDLQAGIDAYFDNCDALGRPYTMQGLAIALDISRDTLCRYSHQDIFSDAIMRARERVQEQMERMLLTRDACNGAKFWLINNDSYSDRRDINMTSAVTIIDDYGPDADDDDA